MIHLSDGITEAKALLEELLDYNIVSLISVCLRSGVFGLFYRILLFIYL